MKKRKFRTFVGDFETTVYDGQNDTDVWASAIVELFTDDVKILHSLPETWDLLKELLKHDNIILYYHNLKFDGEFWLHYLLSKLNFSQAYDKVNDIPVFRPEKDMCNSSFKYSISDRGQWYTITIKYNDHILEIRDSLKLLPFSVKRIGESFGTKHKKLDMEYKGLRYAGCEITPEEEHYIANDVLVVKEALEIMLAQGHRGLTIGSCCLEEFKTYYDKDDYKNFFPTYTRFRWPKSSVAKQPGNMLTNHTAVVGVML